MVNEPVQIKAGALVAANGLIHVSGGLCLAIEPHKGKKITARSSLVVKRCNATCKFQQWKFDNDMICAKIKEGIYAKKNWNLCVMSKHIAKDDKTDMVRGEVGLATVKPGRGWEKIKWAYDYKGQVSPQEAGYGNLVLTWLPKPDALVLRSDRSEFGFSTFGESPKLDCQA